jgi:hypothetical protein
MAATQPVALVAVYQNPEKVLEMGIWNVLKYHIHQRQRRRRSRRRVQQCALPPHPQPPCPSVVRVLF